jgi:hypothetical protein
MNTIGNPDQRERFVILTTAALLALGASACSASQQKEQIAPQAACTDLPAVGAPIGGAISTGLEYRLGHDMSCTGPVPITTPASTVALYNEHLFTADCYIDQRPPALRITILQTDGTPCSIICTVSLSEDAAKQFTMGDSAPPRCPLGK